MFRSCFVLALLLSISYCTCVRAQKTASLADPTTATWGRAVVRGSADNFVVTPSGEVWRATATGDLWHADSLGGSWSRTHYGEDEFDGEHFEQTNFFNDSIGILTGYLHDEDYNDHFYRTINGGKTWTRQPLEKGKWIDAAVALPSGHAWLASSDQVMYRSADAGASWTEIRRPEHSTNQRIVQLDLMDPQHGIAGTGWNRLYLTDDGGDSWSIIPTPLDQKKYAPTSKGHRPRVNGVLHTTDHLFVAQNNRWFYTALVDISWQQLPTNVSILGYDRATDRMYASRTDTIMATTGPFSGTFTSLRPQITARFYSATVANGKLYLLGSDNIGCFDGVTLRNYPLYGRDLPIDEVTYGGHHQGVSWGHIGTEIYQKIAPDGQWRRKFLLEEPIDATVPQKNGTAKIRTTGGNYVFTPSDRSLAPFNLRDSLAFPDLSTLRQITFATTSAGCFHYDADERIFLLRKDAFEEKKGRGRIPQTAVAEILNHLLETPRYGQLKQLPLDPAAFPLFDELVREAIEEKRKARKHDHPRLGSIATTSRLAAYPNLPEAQRLRDAYSLVLAGGRGWSTTVIAVTITFAFRSGPPLELRYQYNYAKPNYLNWFASYGDAQLWLPSGVVRDFYLQQLEAEERIAADAELLLQLAVAREEDGVGE
jgi:photosystem II stability/assembly factor-like uncharacterized protein